MNTTRVIRLLDRDQAIAGLQQIRQDWELAAGGDLVQARGSVAYLLNDCARAIGLNESDRRQVLGNYAEVEK
jgi:hypothetical protein